MKPGGSRLIAKDSISSADEEAGEKKGVQQFLFGHGIGSPARAMLSFVNVQRLASSSPLFAAHWIFLSVG